MGAAIAVTGFTGLQRILIVVEVFVRKDKTHFVGGYLNMGYIFNYAYLKLLSILLRIWQLSRWPDR
jgi:hypothetical protein